MQAAETVTQLTGKENWNVEFIESHGCITQLVSKLIKLENQ